MVNRVETDSEGFILVNDERISQLDAINMAISLTTAVEDSINRNQKNNPRYYDSVEILRRMNSPLGQALSALRKVF